jgi:streptomycin 6-kinase
MSTAPVPDVQLPNGIVVPSRDIERFLWGGRESGIAWATSLPDMLGDYLDRWKITLEPTLPQLSMNLVLFGRSEVHGPVVIKTSPPHKEITAEIDALRLHRSTRIVSLIDADPSVSIMVQRRILPGTTLRSCVERGRITEREAATIAADVIQDYWIQPSADVPFITLEDWFRALYAYRERHSTGNGPLHQRNVELAVQCADELLATLREEVTVHGDLHHDNILLDDEHGWTIIDPKGLVGERGYDIGQWMVNPVGVDRNPDLPQITNDRLDWFSDLIGVERYRLWQWAMVQTVLGDCWNLESNGDLFAQPVADILAGLPEARRI